MKKYDYWDINGTHQLVLSVFGETIVEADVEFQAITKKNPAKTPGIVVREMHPCLPGFSRLLVDEYRKTSRMFNFDKSLWKDAEPAPTSKKVK
jgi:hypothetical protein